MKKFELSLIIVLLVLGCSKATKTDKLSQSSYVNEKVEKYRSKFHFTPEANWMNDPNGLVYSNGYYHLFYQYYPNGTVWGPMHWGHAKSKNLLKWEHMPIALFPDELGYIFSGSAVIDKDNTAGFGKGAMIAIFTYHDPVKEKEGKIDYQTQGIAYSLDEGVTWKKYSENPVIDNPGIRDFRDPKVIWNEDKEIWQLILVAKDHVQIYDSKNLKQWTKISEFRFEDNPPLGVWECPDLFKLKVDGTEEEKWVLIISHGGESAPNGGSGTRYFVGDYDGTTFTTDQKESQWIDYGTDNYAGVTYNNTPDNKRIFIGWMSNWNYANETPTKKWRSAMTLPRELKLINKNGKYLVKSKIIENFKTITTEVLKEEITGHFPYDFQYQNLQQSKISFEAIVNDKLEVILSNSNKDLYSISYDKKTGVFSIDRSQSGNVNFNSNFKKSSFQKVNIGTEDQLAIDIILDASSIEIFINQGQYVITTQVFSNENYTDFNVKNKDGITINNFKIKKIL
ncbi:glycoside hydrolase family 32 protein [Polaribacter sp.]|uniref:glycoside hydrolase family 32 protein n=1 Tax=Polaribacter sp. TaxID=1920175 RepID=UPI003F6D58F6